MTAAYAALLVLGPLTGFCLMGGILGALDATLERTKPGNGREDG